METIMEILSNNETLALLTGAGVFELLFRKIPRVWPITKMVYSFFKVGLKISETIYDGFSKVVEDK